MILSRIYEWARVQPAKTAVIHDDVPLSYAAFARALETTRKFLEDQHLPAGRTALVLAADMLEIFASFDRVRCTVLKAFPRNQTGTKKVQRAVLKLLVSKGQSGGATPHPGP